MTWLEVRAKLEDWRDNGTAHMADDIDPPTKEAIEKALDLAVRCAVTNPFEPMVVVPDGDGGIAIESKPTTLMRTLEFASNGLAEDVRMKDGKHIGSYVLAIIAFILFATPAHAEPFNWQLIDLDFSLIGGAVSAAPISATVERPSVTFPAWPLPSLDCPDGNCPLPTTQAPVQRAPRRRWFRQ